MKKTRLLILTVVSTLLFSLCGCGIGAGDENGRISILFVGNSFVFTGDVPGQLKEIVGLYDVQIDTEEICPGGASLNDSKNEAIETMKQQKFDYVVLQDFGTRPVNDQSGFLSDIKTLCDAAKESGAEPVLYNPAWANDGADWKKPDLAYQMLETEAYETAAKKNDAILVNAGDAWVYVYDKYRDVSLYRDGDDYHANDMGAYYTACVFASTLFDLQIKDAAPNNLYHGDRAVELGQAAWEFVSYYKEHGKLPQGPVTVEPGKNQLAA